MLIYHHYFITIADIVTVIRHSTAGLHTSVPLCDHHVLDTAVLTRCCTDHVRTQICASTRSSYQPLKLGRRASWGWEADLLGQNYLQGTATDALHTHRRHNTVDTLVL